MDLWVGSLGGGGGCEVYGACSSSEGSTGGRVARRGWARSAIAMTGVGTGSVPFASISFLEVHGNGYSPRKGGYLKKRKTIHSERWRTACTLRDSLIIHATSTAEARARRL